MAELEEILKMKEIVEEGNMRKKLPMVQGARPQQASMPSQQAPIAPSMPLQQPSIAPQEKEKKTLVGKILNKDVRLKDGSISKIGIEVVEARIDKMPPV